jgi:diguanylate cyclase (GGDEF)-like protein
MYGTVTDVLDIEMGAFCLFILVMILTKVTEGFGSEGERPDFKVVVISACLIVICDVATRVIESQAIPDSLVAVDLIINALYFACPGIMCFTWLLFAHKRLGWHRLWSRPTKVLLGLPCGVLLVATALTPWMGWLFCVEGGAYHRGPIYPLQFLILGFYFLSNLVMCLRAARSASNRWDRQGALTLSSFMLPPVLGLLLQVIMPGYPFDIAFITAAVLLVFMNLQNAEILHDHLTGINNRRRIESKLQDQLGSLGMGERLVLLMIDVNDFKAINDTYGHPEGDRALTLVAEALTSACGSLRTVIGRFGGDEFEVIWKPKRKDAANLPDLINATMLHLGLDHELPYDLTLSIGMAEETGPSNATPDELLKRADADLYRKKNRFHQR